MLKLQCLPISKYLEVLFLWGFSGASKELDKNFIFSTFQTISKLENLKQFSPTKFDYIVIDETHRAGGESYQRVLDHFTPKFLLGMTATPIFADSNLAAY